MEAKIIREKRRSVAFSASDNGELIVKVPLFLSAKKIQEILNKNSEKIEKMLQNQKAFSKCLSAYKKGELEEKAKRIINERLPFWCEKMCLYPKSVKITSAKKRFGSCSSKGSICFSKYLFMRSQREIDYVIVHELAHLKEMNHSPAFYELIAEVLPDHKEIKRLLKTYMEE